MPKNKDDKLMKNVHKAKGATSKPVSSSRMNDMLSLVGENVGFVGFEPVLQDATEHSGESEEGERAILCDVPSEFQVAVRLLGKKDAVTKLKALREFAELCQNGSKESVLSVSKVWIIHYNKLSLDSDQRVREACQRAMMHFIVQAGKHFAPYLKSVLGHWVCGMNDPYIPAATAAKEAFESAFSEPKRIEVYKYAFDEIILHVQELLNYPVKVSGKVSYSDTRRVQEVAMMQGIHGLAHMLIQVPGEFLQKQTLVSSLWCAACLSKLQKHELTMIRATLYKVYAAVLHAKPELGKKDVVATLMSGLNESLPAVVPHLWHAVLTTVTSVSNWNDDVDVGNTLVPGLLQLVANAGYGAAKQTFPYLLPIIDQAYTQLSEEAFPVAFLNKLVLGMQLALSIQDLQCMLTTFKDYCLFLVKHHREDVPESSVFQAVSALLNHALTSAFNPTRNNLIIECVGSITQEVLRLGLASGSEVELQTYLANCLCEKVCSVDKDECFSGVSKFLEVACAVEGQQHRRSHPSVGCNPIDERILHFFQPILTRLGTNCLNRFAERRSVPHLRLFLALLKTFRNVYKLELIVKSLSGSESLEAGNSHPTQLLETCASCLLNSREEGVLQSTDTIELRVEVTIWIAIHTGQTSPAPKVFLGLCQLLPQFSAVFFMKCLGTPLEDAIIPKILPDILSSANLDYLHAVDVYQKVLSMSVLSVSRELANQLLSSVCDTAIMIMTDSKQEPLSQIQQEWLLLLSHIHEGVVEGGNVAKITDVLRCTLEQQLSTPGKCSEMVMVQCFTHLLSLSQQIGVSTHCFSVLSKCLWDHCCSISDPSRIVELSETYTRLIQKGSGVGVFDAFSHIMDSIQVSQQPLSDKVIEQYGTGNMIFSASRNLTSHSELELPELVCKALALAYPISDNVALSPEVNTDVLAQLLLILCFAQEWIKESNSHEELICSKLLWKATECVLIHLQNSPKQLEDVLHHSFGISNVYGGMWAVALNCLVQCVDWQQDVLTQDLTITLLQSCSSETFQSSLYSMTHAGVVKEPLHSMPPQDSSLEVIVEAVNKAAIQLSVFHNSDRAKLIAQEACMQLEELQNSKAIFQWESKLSQCTLCQLDALFAFCNLVTVLAETKSVPDTAWDFILCTVVMCVQCIPLEGRMCLSTSLLLSNIFALFRALDHYFSESTSPPSEEWQEFFKPAVVDVICPVFLTTLRNPPEKMDHYELVYHWSLCKTCISTCPTTEMVLKLPALTPAITSKWYCLQVSAYAVARKMKMIVCSEQAVQANEILFTELEAFLRTSLMQIAGNLLPVTSHLDLTPRDILLADPVVTHSSTALMLIWCVAVDILQNSSLEVKGQVQNLLKETATFERVMEAICLYLAPHLVKGSFLPSLYQSIDISPKSSSLACFVYWKMAEQFPVMLRQWYLALQRQDANEIRRFTSQCISPVLRKDQLKALQECSGSSDTMQVKVFTEVSEVSVTYKVDDVSLELFVTLPEDYPLHPPSVKEGKRVRVEATQWRKWMLQLNIFLTNQNGSLHDGLQLWKANLDKHFSGVQDCMICFSIIHTANYSLPKLRCKTCQNKFHSACLYKWFSTSGKSTCPLCRNLF